MLHKILSIFIHVIELTLGFMNVIDAPYSKKCMLDVKPDSIEGLLSKYKAQMKLTNATFSSIQDYDLSQLEIESLSLVNSILQYVHLTKSKNCNASLLSHMNFDVDGVVAEGYDSILFD